MALHYTKKNDEKKEHTVNATEFIDRMCELNKKRQEPVRQENIESTI